MFIPAITALVAAYALLGLLAVAVALQSRWPLPIRTCGLVLVIGLFVASRVALPQVLGWPARNEPPPEFRLIASHVLQPDKASEHPGAVFLWVTDAHGLADAVPPRAYVLPWTAELHESVISATARLNKGVAQLGEFQPAQAGPEPLSPVRFFDVPDPLFPEY